MSKNEHWAPIDGFPSYEVSTLGRVRRNGRVLAQYKYNTHPDRRPWSRVTLHDDRVPTQRAVHVLVANAFLGERPKGMSVHFKNGISTDARLENLYYGPARSEQTYVKSTKGRIK
ncbi:HNH endonuclease [Amycolatopsis regifaucium]|uniref:HNH nuclease domain-containing protein n=1 Tax=Amycolatopsis regifaucium TaxID=546365 RepID=A0ABX3DL00_9PSEU|nr:hypothetical protein ATP06_0229975 [Amycolatopsis regifaucium]